MARVAELSINGRRHRVDAEPDDLLLWVLREQLDLTGAKYGCGEGQCGACTVLVDGKAVRSCRTPLARAAASEIITIEGLERGGRLHPLQQAFLDQDALQCGYCTPGMIMAGIGLLLETPQPTRGQILEQMQGNVCRCGEYRRIVDAIAQAAATGQEEDR